MKKHTSIKWYAISTLVYDCVLVLCLATMAAWTMGNPNEKFFEGLKFVTPSAIIVDIGWILRLISFRTNKIALSIAPLSY